MPNLRTRSFWLKAAFVIAVVATLFFVVRLVAFSIYWADPEHRDQTIEAWMTPGYVAHSWDVPRDVMNAALGIEPSPEAPPLKRKKIEDLAKERGISVARLIARIDEAIAIHRARK